VLIIDACGFENAKPVQGHASTKMSKGKLPHEEDPRETPLDDPRQQTDWPTTRQTDKPWKGPVEKDQQNTNTDIDLEKWRDSNTH